MTRPRFLVLGIGNELFTDEGIGVVAARAFAKDAPADVEVVDGSTLGIELTPTIADRDGVIVLDSLPPDHAAPGTVVSLDDGDVKRQRRLVYSVHQIDLVDALTAAELSGVAPKRFSVVGAVPASLETGYGLTATCAGAVSEMVARTARCLREWGATDA